jgi:hypothetical protein
VWPWLTSFLLCLLIVAREYQHQKIQTTLLDRLLTREGFEPVTELPEEDSPVREQVEQLAGGVRIKMPSVTYKRST